MYDIKCLKLHKNICEDLFQCLVLISILIFQENIFQIRGTMDWSIVTHDDYRLVHSHTTTIDWSIVFVTLPSHDVTKSCMKQIDLNITFFILAPFVFIQYEKFKNWLATN